MAQRDEVVRIQAGVIEPFIRKRSSPPVGPLVALIDFHLEFRRNQIAQSAAFPAQRTAGDASVEQIVKSESEISFQSHYVVFCTVEYFFNFRIAEYGPQFAQPRKSKRIDQKVDFRYRELNETHSFPIDVHAVRFGIYGNERLCGKGFDHRVQRIGVGDKHWRFKLGRIHGYHYTRSVRDHGRYCRLSIFEGEIHRNVLGKVRKVGQN